MTIEIKHMDSFNFIKGILSIATETISAACYDDLSDVVKQMKTVPTTNDDGYFVEETKSILDPKEQMQMYLDDLCPFKLRQEVSQPEFWQYYDNLRKNIGEAMGPVSYAAFGLARYIDEHDILLGTKWVWDFVKHYEKNWKF